MKTCFILEVKFFLSLALLFLSFSLFFSATIYPNHSLYSLSNLCITMRLCGNVLMSFSFGRYMMSPSTHTLSFSV